MKKILLTGLFCILLINCCNSEGFCENKTNSKKELYEQLIIDKKNYNTEDLKQAIDAYKSGDFLSSISTLQEYTKKNDKNAIAWYYLGNSYMNIAMTKEANEAFNKVISLNSIESAPKLTSYAIQAQLCMKSKQKCKYENFNASEVKKLKENPSRFISEYYDSLNRKSIKSDDVIQIENLIKGSYANNIHPEAQDFILKERTKITTSQINSGKNN